MQESVNLLKVISILFILTSIACNSGEIIEEMEEEVVIIEYPRSYKYNHLEIDSIKEYTLQNGELIETNLSGFYRYHEVGNRK